MFLSNRKEFKRNWNIRAGAGFIWWTLPKKKPWRSQNGLTLIFKTSAPSGPWKKLQRIDVEDDYTLILVDVPTQEERNNKSYYVTIPLGIIVTDEVVVTTCLEDISLMDNFLNHRVRNFYTFMKTRFVFQILYRNAQLYLTALRSIDRQSDKLEAQVGKCD